MKKSQPFDSISTVSPKATQFVKRTPEQATHATVDKRLSKAELLRVCEEFKSERDAHKAAVLRAFDQRNTLLAENAALRVTLAVLTDSVIAKPTIRGIGKSIAALINGWFR